MRDIAVTEKKGSLGSAPIVFPYPQPPAVGEVRVIAPGILWARIPLPFRLDHVNIYLIEDEDGWVIIDTGIDHALTRAAWEALFSGPLAGKRFTKLIVTHDHPDHFGLAGWLCDRLAVPMLASQTTYLSCLNIASDRSRPTASCDFYRLHGMSDRTAGLVSTQGNSYLDMVTPLPTTFRRLVSADELILGGRRLTVLSGDGHAPEQIMLYSASDRILFAADQVIAKISPNISVWAVEPDGDPLGLYLRSLGGLQRDLPEDTLVLPAHQLPFRGLHRRCQELMDHHEQRCRLVAQACRAAPKTVADLIPVLFKGELDPHQLGFAFSETHAHVNRMVMRGDIGWLADDGVRKVVCF